MDKIKDAIQLAKSSITQCHLEYAEAVSMLMNILRLAELEQDEETRVLVKSRLDTQASNAQEAVQTQQQQIEEWEELARNTQRQYEAALHLLILKRDRMIV